jgi:pimeloyl-ACP methyl ester carboxylesterase
VHGSWGDRHIWESVREGLERSFRTIAYSRRGHGQSTGGGSLDDDVRDLAALIEHLDAGPAHLAGNSLGATICLRLVASRPNLVASVSAHEPPLFALLAGDPAWKPWLEELQQRVGGVLELIEQDRTPEAAERFVEDVALGPAPGVNSRRRSVRGSSGMQRPSPRRTPIPASTESSSHR